MLKSVVCIPTIKDFYYTPHRGSFLGAHILSKLLENAGFKNKLFIFPNMKKKPVNIQLPMELEYLNPFLSDKKLLFFKNYKRFGYTHDFCAKIILKENPDIIFISCFAFCYANEAIDLARQIKNKKHNVLIVVGGAGVTVFPQYFEKFDEFDFVLSGNCETAIPLFLKNVFNMDFCSNDNIPFTLAHTKSFKYFEQYSTILSVGCPKKCSFCSNHLVFGRTIKTVDLKSIEKDLRNFDLNREIHINFEDDNIFFYKEHFFNILRIFKNKFRNIKFSCENGIDYLMISDNDLIKMIDYGFKQFNFSLVSANEETLHNEKRISDLEHFENLVNTANKFNIKIFAYFIVGLKNDTFEKIIQTVEFLKKLNVIMGISPFYPVPGIKGYEDKSFFEKYPPYMFCGSSCYPWNKRITTKDIIYFFDLTRRINLKML